MFNNQVEHQNQHSNLLSTFLIQAKKQSIGDGLKIGDDTDLAKGSDKKENIPKGRAFIWVSQNMMEVCV